jgi:four helix bundle protein
MNREEIKARTKQFALRVIRLVEVLPASYSAEAIGRQLLRAATSVGANYRAACRASSKAEFIAKLGIVEEESDECSYWLELLVEAGLMKHERVADLLQEADELTAIMVSSIQTARSK